jgi:hypothetical protein
LREDRLIGELCQARQAPLIKASDGQSIGLLEGVECVGEVVAITRVNLSWGKTSPVQQHFGFENEFVWLRLLLTMRRSHMVVPSREHRVRRETKNDQCGQGWQR